MLAKVLEISRRIGAFVQHFFGFKPYIPPVAERESPEKEPRPIPKTPERALALPIINKYEKIDWKDDPPAYEKRPGVLSYRERQFYWVLVKLIGREHHILSMVRMGDVISLSRNETKDRKFYNNNIFCKHFDYVICGKKKFEPLLVIELDDPKHQWEHRWQADNFKDKACEVAGLPLLRIKVREQYDVAEINKQIRQKLQVIYEES
jgi:very-short-patch-repair endonuclease